MCRIERAVDRIVSAVVIFAIGYFGFHLIVYLAR
jgi:hypothetical protein